MNITIKTDDEVKKLFLANQVVADVLFYIETTLLKEGISTLELEKQALSYMYNKYGNLNLKPAFLNYMGYPNAFCISLNDEVVHGIPRKDKILKNGDIVSIDFGVELDGYYGDSAITLAVGKVGNVAKKLMMVTQKALYIGISKAKPGNSLSDIGRAIQKYVESKGFNVVRDYVGHGIGRELHEDPPVPNFFSRAYSKIKLKKGMVLAIEPMVNVGTYRVKIDNDGWTVRTLDGSLSSHFEHTIVVDNPPKVLSIRQNELINQN